MGNNEAAAGHFEDRLLYLEIPFDPPVDARDPYPDFARLRRESPVQLITDRFGEGGGNLAFLYRHAEVVAALQNNEVFSSIALHNALSPMMGEKMLVGMDEPAHGRYRNLIAPSLRPRLLAKWEHALIHKVADALVDTIAPRGRADLVQDFTFGFPARVVAQVIGIPQDNFLQFQLWAIDIVGGAGDPEPGIKASKELRAYLAPFLEARRAQPQDDIISQLVTTEIDGERLDEEAIYSFLLLLLPAGIETTYRALGSLLFNLLSNPDQFEAVRKDRGLLPRAIEENLRTDPPIQYPLRMALADFELGGVKIPANTVVMPMLAAANRDPALVEDPERFNIFRSQIKHVTFGNGVHTCIGLHLAKLEINIAMNKLMDRLPNLRLDSDTARKTDAHIRGKSFRSPTSVPVLWDV